MPIRLPLKRASTSRSCESGRKYNLIFTVLAQNRLTRSVVVPGTRYAVFAELLERIDDQSKRGDKEPKSA